MRAEPPVTSASTGQWPSVGLLATEVTGRGCSRRPEAVGLDQMAAAAQTRSASTAAARPAGRCGSAKPGLAISVWLMEGFCAEAWPRPSRAWCDHPALGRRHGSSMRSTLSAHTVGDDVERGAGAISSPQTAPASRPAGTNSYASSPEKLIWKMRDRRSGWWSRSLPCTAAPRWSHQDYPPLRPSRPPRAPAVPRARSRPTAR